MIIGDIKSIDFQKLFNEKQSKDLSSSLIRLISDVSNNLENLCENTKEQYSFSIIFDNKSVFNIYSYFKDDTIITKVTFTNCYNEKQSVISLQDALNINKYSLEIEEFVMSNFKLKNYEFEGYYTEQSINKIFPIYREKKIGLEYNIFIESQNVKE